MREFDYSFLKKSLLPAKILELAAEIDNLNKEFDSLKKQYSSFCLKAEKTARLQSVKFSNAIEGVFAPDERILQIANQSSYPQSLSEQEIAGYNEAYIFAINNYNNFKIQSEDLLKLHGKIFAYTDYLWKGEYKTENNIIFQETAAGRRRLRFTPSPAAQTPEVTDKLLLAFNKAKNDAEINKLALISCFCLDFSCIHPFFDGNGRTGRLLFFILLLKSGYSFAKYSSIDEEVFIRKKLYYDALYKSSKYWRNSGNNYTYFIDFCLSTVLFCLKKIEKMKNLEK